MPSRDEAPNGPENSPTHPQLLRFLDRLFDSRDTRSESTAGNAADLFDSLGDQHGALLLASVAIEMIWSECRAKTLAELILLARVMSEAQQDHEGERVPAWKIEACLRLFTGESGLAAEFARQDVLEGVDVAGMYLRKNRAPDPERDQDVMAAAVRRYAELLVGNEFPIRGRT